MPKDKSAARIMSHADTIIKFMVSSSSGAPYTVTYLSNNDGLPGANSWHCECKSFQYRSSERTDDGMDVPNPFYRCKHILEVGKLAQEIVDSIEETAQEEETEE